VSRQSLGLSVERAALLAGMEASEWLAIEAGRIPEPEQLRPMADTLELGFQRLAQLDRLRRNA
jgi:hypothetical protein